MTELNKKQVEAVQSIQFPTLVVAVPGAGKTRVIVEKYLYLYSLGYPLERLVAITYTNKAANEMEQRLKSRISKFISYPYISTIHSFALRLMIENQQSFGFKKGSTVIDSDDSKEIIENILIKNNITLVNVDDAYKFINFSKEYYDEDTILFCFQNAHHLLKQILKEQKLKNSSNKNEIIKEKIKIFKKYQEYLYESSLYDYSDLILYPILTMKYDVQIREKIRSQFDYILVDEFQDINNLQNIFLIMISNGANITAVGDEDQSIYGFRGASIEPIMNFESNFKNAKIIYMDENYRSKKKIINCANDIISNNKIRRDKKTISVREEEGEVEINFFSCESDMFDFIISKLNQLTRLDIKPENIAILARTSWLLIKIQNRFLDAQIPYKMLKGVNFFERKEIKYTIYYISFKLNLNNEFLFTKIAGYPKRGIGPKTLNKITELKSTSDKNFLEILLSFNNEKVNNFGRFLVKLFNQQSISGFCEILLTESGLLEEWQKEGQENFLERKENFELLLDIARKIEDENKGKNEDVFQYFLSKIIPFFKDEGGSNGFVLGTLHSAKGLEFDAVFLPYVSETILPYKRYDEEADTEEERRLLYVGMTRAKDYLYILHSDTIELRNIDLKPSHLINPILNKYLIESKKKGPKFSIGEYIESPLYGYGKIKDIKKLRNGKFVYIVENIDGVMQFVEGIHEIKKKEFDY